MLSRCIWACNTMFTEMLLYLGCAHFTKLQDFTQFLHMSANSFICLLELKQIKANCLLVRLPLLTSLACAPCTSGLADLAPRLQILLGIV